MNFYFKTNKQVSEFDGEHFIKVSVSYDIGNSGYRPSRRGYSIHVQPVTIKNCVSYIWEQCIPMNGYKMFLLEVTKKSNKAELQAYELAKNVYHDIIERVESAEGCNIIGAYTI